MVQKVRYRYGMTDVQGLYKVQGTSDKEGQVWVRV